MIQVIVCCSCGGFPNPAIDKEVGEIREVLAICPQCLSMANITTFNAEQVYEDNNKISYTGRREI